MFKTEESRLEEREQSRKADSTHAVPTALTCEHLADVTDTSIPQSRQQRRFRLELRRDARFRRQRQLQRDPLISSSRTDSSTGDDIVVVHRENLDCRKEER